ncbi:hypothetical protein M8013_12410 [Enterobacteriaceae bacterium H4N4]|uniref:Uncharacterized protein n=1 Tax=Silvania confinis TaxID=2926470 RepID=A0A9J6QH56_9ENTR|nr:hypothetical protein [Silvania confinis]MCU6669547.1 hypothetical protein [Silvania confinis]
MMNFFTQFSTKVDYGERESCCEQALLHVAEYQEYLSCDVQFCPVMNAEMLTVVGALESKSPL